MKQGHNLTKVSSRIGAQSAILFLHGFTGDADETWDRFPFILGAAESLQDWDIFSLGYHASFLPGTRGVWSAASYYLCVSNCSELNRRLLPQ
jgi:hypothetical protein